MTIITSPQNPKVKYVIGLRGRRERLQSGLVLVEGHDELSLVLASGIAPTELFFCPAMFRDPTERDLLNRLSQTRLIEVDERVFQKIAYRENPDGWLATVPLPQKSLDELTLSPAPFIVIAEGVEKPGNLGAMLRTADAAGVDAVIASDPLTDWGNPNVVRASKGTLFTVQVAEGRHAEIVDWLNGRGIQSVVATPDAKLPFTEADFTKPIAIVMGTEHEGISEAWLRAADIAVSIPMFGKVNSLNVSAAAALMMYEVVRQRRS